MAGCGFRPRSKGTFGERVHSSGAARRRSSCRVAHAHARREPQDAAKCSALRIPHAHTHTRAAPTRCGEPEYARLQPPSHTMRCAHRRQHQVQPPAATVGPAAGGRYRRGGPGDCPAALWPSFFLPGRRASRPPRPSATPAQVGNSLLTPRPRVEGLPCSLYMYLGPRRVSSKPSILVRQASVCQCGLFTDSGQSRRSAVATAPRPSDLGQSSPALSSSRWSVLARSWSSVVCQITNTCGDRTYLSSCRTCAIHVSHTQLVYHRRMRKNRRLLECPDSWPHDCTIGQFGYHFGGRCPEWSLRVRIP